MCLSLASQGCSRNYYSARGYLPGDSGWPIVIGISNSSLVVASITSVINRIIDVTIINNTIARHLVLRVSLF